MIDYSLTHICTYTATLSAPEVIGPVPEGIKATFYITGGEFHGPKLKGKLRPVGADWITIRKDGIGLGDVKITLETEDGALILLTYPGIIDLGEDGYNNFLAGVLPPVPRIQTTPRFSTAHPEYAWLNRLYCFGVGEVDLPNNQVTYDVYAVR